MQIEVIQENPKNAPKTDEPKPQQLQSIHREIKVSSDVNKDDFEKFKEFLKKNIQEEKITDLFS